MPPMFEVYTGSRPGRRAVLLVAVGAVLAGTLALAWVQARGKRALGPPQAIAGTPLRVRPPRGWVAARDEPGSFVLPVRRTIRGREIVVADRKIQFDYRNLPAFVPPDSLLLAEGKFSIADLEAARIGRFPAVQVRQIERRQWGRQMLAAEVILRLAVLPNGDLISVRYTPMTDLTLADEHLLNAVCDSLELTGPELSASAADAQQRAGVVLRFDHDWQVVLSSIEEVPGFFVGGMDGHFPGWALGVFRTWLAADRSPADLLLDFAAAVWLLPEAEVNVETSRQDDGAQIARLQHPRPERNRSSVASARLVSRSPAETALLLTYTDQTHLETAEAVADRLASELRIQPLDILAAIDAAGLAGRELAARLTERGGMPWWGQLAVQLSYRGETWRGEQSLLLVREPLGRNPARGYRATIRRRFSYKPDEQTQWRIDGRGLAYEYSTELYVADGLRIGVRESRSGPDEPVMRVITFNEQERYARSFRPGPTFICPPLEGLAEAWVAREPGALCLNEVSTVLGRGAHTRLLRHLPPDGQYARVLVLDDFWPLGTIVAVDEEGEVQYEVERAGRLERVSSR